jgi:release factor glutamine methyltransferase
MALSAGALPAAAEEAASALSQAHTIGAARRALMAEFIRAGLDQPEADARVLLQFALGLERAKLVSAADRPLAASEREALAGLAARRLRREPVAYIVGEREFWGLRLRVGPDVLIPRPDTETVVAAALAAIDGTVGRDATIRIADLGTGSGALLLALLSELPQAFGVGTDLSRGALALARANAASLGLARRAAFLACDFAKGLGGGFDLVVSNPPYVATAEIATLAPDVRDYEPAAALDGGRDGLAAYRALAAQCPRLLAEQGRLVVEIGSGQAEAVTALFDGRGLRLSSSAYPDLAGIARALVLQCGRAPNGLETQKKSLGICAARG